MSTRRGRQGGSYNAGMDALGMFLVAVLAWAIVFGWLGGWVASQTGRSTTEAWLLGVLFGPLGILIALLLPRD